MINFSASTNPEFLSKDAIRTLQTSLLREHLLYACSASPFYRSLFAINSIVPSAVTLENLKDIPLTDRTVLGEKNGDFLAVPMAKIVDIVLSSGTTGIPTSIMYTENDLQRLAYNEEISFRSCGIVPEDVALLTCTVDRCFIAGLAYFSGIRRLGAAAIRNGLASPESHLEIIKRLQPTVLIGVPTFLLKLARYLVSQGIDPVSTAVRKIVCIGEPIRNAGLDFLRAGEELERLWGANVYST